MEVIVLNNFVVYTVPPTFAPNTVSVCDIPLISVPTIENVFLVSLPTDDIDTLVPSLLAIAATVPTFIPELAASEAICVTVLNTLVPVTVLLLTPVIVSVCAFPSISVPVMVNVSDELLLALEIEIRELIEEAA